MRWGAGSFRTSENKIRSLSSVRLLRPLSQLSEREHTLWLDWLVEDLFCRFLRPKSLSMPYSFGLILLAVSLLLQGWSEKYDRTNNQIIASMIVAKYREKPCGGDFLLHPQDLTLQAIKATAIPLPDRIWLRSFWKNLLADRLAKPFLALLWYHFPSVVAFHVRFCSC